MKNSTNIFSDKIIGNTQSQQNRFGENFKSYSILPFAIGYGAVTSKALTSKKNKI